MYYLIIINIISFIICYCDKIRAIKNEWRIKENILLTFSFIGGCYGFITAMYLFHHKTKKCKFKILVYISIILWTFLILYMIEKNSFLFK